MVEAASMTIREFVEGAQPRLAYYGGYRPDRPEESSRLLGPDQLQQQRALMPCRSRTLPTVVHIGERIRPHYAVRAACRN